VSNIGSNSYNCGDYEGAAFGMPSNHVSFRFQEDSVNPDSQSSVASLPEGSEVVGTQPPEKSLTGISNAATVKPKARIGVVAGERGLAQETAKN